jgi:hypothetical protein
MDIIKIKHRDLLKFVQSDLYLNSHHYPISQIRAASQYKNPSAKPEDDVLFTIYENNELIAYVGVLPDNIYFKDKNLSTHSEHLGWLSCIWVHDEFQGKGLAIKLLKEAYHSWEAKLLATEFTKEALNLYTKSQLFNDLTELKGYRLYYRSCLSKLLPSKNKKWQKVIGLLKLIDNSSNFFIDACVNKKNRENYTIEETIDDQTWNFIQKHQSENELFKKDQTDLNWVLNYPWIINKEEDIESRKYYFSSVSKQFETKVFKIFDKENKIAAVIIFTNREGQIKIPFFYTNQDSTNSCFEIFNYYLKSIKADTLTTYHSALVNYIDNFNRTYLFKKAFKRNYLITQILEKSIHESQIWTIQDGDGDTAFT